MASVVPAAGGLRGLVEIRIDQLNGAIDRCERRIASREIDECDVHIPWQRRDVSLDEARDVVWRLQNGLRTFSVEVKSFIHRLDVSSLQGDVRTRAERLFARVLVNPGFAENPATPSPDADDYRLWSRLETTILCDGDRISDWEFEGPETRFGTEAWVLATEGAVDEPLQAWPSTQGSSPAGQVGFSYRVKGRPNAVALPSFYAVRSRTCYWIWHRVEGTFTCSGGAADISLQVSGSGFPSHRFWIDGRQQPTIYQRPLASLWECDSSDPTLVR